MNFLKVEWTKKRGVIALMATGLIVTSFILGGYVATGTWNPWGHRHYYQNLDVNFGYCVSGSQNFCSSVHNTMFNSGVVWIQQVTQDKNTPTNGCAVSTTSGTCQMAVISLSAFAATFAAGDATYGATNGNCAVAEGGTEIAANGLSRALGTVTDLSGATGSQTNTIVHQFTATGTQAVQDACLVSTTTAGAAGNIELAAATFTSVTLNNLDTITITWTLTWNWS
jgi:hypothetical protein